MATQEMRTAVVIDAKDRTGRAFRDTRRGVESVSRLLGDGHPSGGNGEVAPGAGAGQTMPNSLAAMARMSAT